jgi:hypothetical protein
MQDAHWVDVRRERPVMAGLAANLAVFVGTPLVVNGVIFGFGLEQSGAVLAAASGYDAWRTAAGGVG